MTPPDAKTLAWILLAVPETGGSRRDLLALADAINHAVPTERELSESWKWLHDHALVVKLGSQYSLTESGRTFVSSARRARILETWAAVEKQLELLPPLPLTGRGPAA